MFNYRKKFTKDDSYIENLLSQQSDLSSNFSTDVIKKLIEQGVIRKKLAVREEKNGIFYAVLGLLLAAVLAVMFFSASNSNYSKISIHIQASSLRYAGLVMQLLLITVIYTFIE
jgi:hypothetical protein